LTLASGAKSKPELDEGSFQQLLAAAYVVQQHNDGLGAKDPAQSTSSVLSEIAEIQSLVRAGGFDLNAAARLTIERLQKITKADRAYIFILNNGALDCIAEAGPIAAQARNCCVADSIIANEKLKSGELFQSSDAQRDPFLNTSLYQGTGSLIASPIHRFDQFAGAIELRSTRVNAFREGDARAASLMSGLMSSLFERTARAESREKISITHGPQVAAAGPVTTTPGGNFEDSSSLPDHSENSQIQPGDHPRVLPVEMPGQDRLEPWRSDQASPAKSVAENDLPAAGIDLPSECRVCGRPFGADEAFCGQCSMPRLAGAPSEDLQSKWASMWYMQKAHENQQKAPPARNLNLRPSGQIMPPLPRAPVDPTVRVWHVPEPATRRNSESAPIQPSGIKPVAHDESLFFFDSEEENPTPTRRTSDFPGEAANMPEAADGDQDLLQSTWHAVWVRTRRRHATLALTAVGLLLVFMMLAVWPSSKNSQLTWFQSVLVELGLAEVPAHTPVFAGSPDVRVWVDVHTALYYCQGSDLYGKTPGGHFATQHEAQQDEFEPATRVACP
jgi:hypothetical protein